MHFPDSLPKRPRSTSALLAALLAVTAPAFAALHTIGPDTQGVGRVFTDVDAPAGAVSLGDGSMAFNGGLAFSVADDRFYAIANDSFGQSVLTSFSAEDPASLSTPITLGSGFVGGLAAQGSRLYAVGQDFYGAASLYQVDGAGARLVGALAGGLYGGLTFNPRDGLLYGIAADDLGVQRRLVSIDATAMGGPSTTVLFDLGDGSRAFQGGLAWDDTDARFVAIANDATGASQLVAFSSTGASTLMDLATPLGAGYVNAGLAWTAPAVPEPQAAVLFVLGLASLTGLHVRRRRGQPPSASSSDLRSAAP